MEKQVVRLFFMEPLELTTPCKIGNKYRTPVHFILNVLQNKFKEI